MRITPAAIVCALAGAAAISFTATPASASQPTTWNFTQTHVPQAQAPGHYGNGVTVAVLDTWIDSSHPDFGGRILAGADCVGGSCKPGLAPQDGCEPHGTHVAGIITSSTYGVAPRARILPVRVLADHNGTCSADSGDVARAVDWAANHGARIINISLGTAVATGSVKDVTKAVEDASARGILVVAAAGNQQAPVGNAYGKDALVVAATGPSGQLASYSQRGDGVDLAAPGGDPVGSDCTAAMCIVSTWSEHRFAAYAGTSMAAPNVAGVAALLWGQNPSRSREDVVSRLTSTAHPMTDAGSGLVDAQRALGVSTSATPPTPKPTPTPTPTKAATQPVTTAAPKATPQPAPIVAPTKASAPKATRTPSQATVIALPAITKTQQAASTERRGPIGAAIALAVSAAISNLYVSAGNRKRKRARAARNAYAASRRR